MFLVRHGETVGESSIRFHGATDVALADVGRSQVQRLGPFVAEAEFAAVVHSPLSRARESAEILIAEMRRAPARVEVEDDFRELDFGRFEGMTVEEIEAAAPSWFVEWQAGRAKRFPDGDSIPEFRERVGAAFVRLVERYPAGDLLVVAHKGVLKNALATLCGHDFSQMRTWDMDLGSLWVLEFDGEWILRRSNVVG